MPKSPDLLLEHRQKGRSPWGIRFYADGLVKEYSDQVMKFEGGEIVTHPQALAWRKLTRLAPAELEKLLAAVRQANFFTIPDQVGDPQRVRDGIPMTWTVNLDGHSKTVQGIGSEASDHPGLKRITDAIQEVTADAFDRETGEA
jgi:hypothetical protein